VNDHQQPFIDLGAIFGAYIGAIIFIWVASALVASGVAPRGRGGEFFVLTLFFLGPLGVGFAAVAAPREAYVSGRRFVCPRCTAAQYVEEGVYTFDCCRCHQHADVEYGRFGGPRVEAASKSKVAPRVTPAVEKTTTSTSKVAPSSAPGVEKTTTVRCNKCQHTQKVAISASAFECENCNARLKRRAETS
jgi:hypothetical protein